MVHVKPKRPLVPVPYLQSTINEIVQASTVDSLIQVIDKFESPYDFERSEERNLINWYRVLNRFDELLERYVDHRNIFASPTSSTPPHSSPPTPVQPTTSPTSQTPTHKRSLPDPVLPTPPEQNDHARVEDPHNPTTVNPDTADQRVRITPSPSAGQPDTVPAGRVFTPTPYLVLLILRLIQRLLRNSSHDTRHVFNSVEHMGALLADENSAIVLLSLEILNLLLQRSNKFRSMRVALTLELSERLLDLSLGLGGRENGLGLLDCCSSKTADSLSPEGKMVTYEYTRCLVMAEQNSAAESERRNSSSHEQPSRKSSADPSPRHIGPLPIGLPTPNSHTPPKDLPNVKVARNMATITIKDVSTFDAEERWLVTDFAQRHALPRTKRFSLLVAFRRAKSFSTGREARIEAAVIRLCAITVLFQLQHMQPVAQDTLSKEPELLQDIVALARADSADGVDDIPRCLRNMAIRCITAMASDRHRASSIMTVTGVTHLHGVLPTLLRTEVAALIASSSENTRPNDSADMDVTSEDVISPSVGQSQWSRGNSTDLPPSLLVEYERTSNVAQSIMTTEVILSLVHSLALTAGSSGATPLANSGVLGILIPLLSDKDPRHARVVSQAIRTMQSIIEVPVQSVGCQIFRDQDGLSLVANRISSEIGVDEDTTEAQLKEHDEAVEVEALKRRGESRALYQRLAQRQMTLVEALENQPPSSFATSRGHLPHSKWSLLRALHQLLLAGLGSGGNEVRELVVNSQLPHALRKILAQPFHHGGSLFQAAASVTTDIAHAEPTATAELVKAGIANAVLHTIRVGLPPCGEAVRCIPNLLAALCLAGSARDTIVKSSPLEPYLLRLATPFYTRALHGEIPPHVGNAVDELMRHVEALRPDGNKAMLEYLNMSMTFVKEDDSNLPKSGTRKASSSRTPSWHNSHKVERATDKSTESGSDSSKANTVSGDGETRHPDVILVHKMKLAVANNSSRLAGFVQGSSEHQDAIACGPGLQYMVTLRLAPALACAEAAVKEHGTFSRHYPTPSTTIVSLSNSLRNLSSRHGGAVLKQLFESILKDATKALKIASLLDDRWLPEEDGEPSNEDTDKKLSDQALEDITNKDLKKLTSEDVVSPANRHILRKRLSEAIASLRVGVVLLSGLSRGGPGSSAGAWENSGGSQFAAVISVVERAARCHLAKVYTGLTLSASSDGDLSTSRVTAAADPALKAINHQDFSRHLGDVDRSLGYPISKSKPFEEACKTRLVPPEGSDPVRQDVRGLAWHLVTFAVAAQRLYSTLSRGLSFSSRRHSRDPSRYAASARSLAATIGRIFALHLKAAAPLWDENVMTMGKGRVAAAWDYVRGILIEMKGTLFDEPRAMTQGLILRSFLEAGGAQALMDAARPAHLLKAASFLHDFGGSEADGISDEEKAQVVDCVQHESLTTCSYLIALGEVYDQKSAVKGVSKNDSRSAAESIKQDDETSSDSVSNQARAISRIAMSESETWSKEPLSSEDPFRKLVMNKNYLSSLKAQVEATSKVVLNVTFDSSVRRIASDAWSTICRFLFLLAACPGLLNPNMPPASGLTPSPGEWGQRDIPRSAQTLVLLLLRDVMKNPEDLLSVYTPEWSPVTDVLGIAQATANTYRVLSQSSSRPESGAGNFESWDDFMEAREPTPSRPLSPDPNMVRNLVEMGFPEHRALMALRRTAGGIEFAMEWLLSNHENEEGSDGSVEEERRDWDGDEQEQDTGDGGDGGDSGDVDEDGAGAPDPDQVDDEDDDEEEEEEEEDDDDDDDDDDDGNDGNAVIYDEEEEGHMDADDDDAGNEDAVESETPANDNDTPQDHAMADAPDGGSSATNRASDAARLGQLGALSTEPAINAPKEENSGPKEPLKTSPNTLSLQHDGKELLDQSIAAELELLHEAIHNDEVVVDAALVCAAAAKQVGSSYIATGKGSKERKTSTIVTPMSVESFKSSKKDLFASLADFTRVLITKADKYPHEAHLPYVAIDMLRILQKDKGSPAEHDHSFAQLLSAGLRMLLEVGGKKTTEFPELKGQTASMWVHFGGQRARSALHEAGAFDLSMEAFVRIVEEWERELGAPLVDKEATGPIEKLRISERVGNRRLSKYMQEEASGEYGQQNRHRSSRTRLLVPTREDVMKLGLLCTCMLVLDAQIRYSEKDRAVQRAQKLYGSADGKSDSKKNGDKKNRMETDENGFDSDDALIREDGFAEHAAGAGADGEGTGTGANSGSGDSDKEKDDSNVKDMDVDTKGIEEMEEELKVKRAEATKKREHITEAAVSALAEMTDWPSMVGGEVDGDRVRLLRYCIRLLKIMKNLEAGDALFAVLQLLTSLTREWAVAKVGIDEGLVELLLGLAHLESRLVRSVNCQMVRTLTKTILRHMVEDPETLKEAMMMEIRGVISSGPTRARSTFPLKTLLASTSPLAARDLGHFVKALGECVTSAGERSGHVELREYKAMTSGEARKRLEVSTNVTRVVSSLCGLLVGKQTQTNEANGSHVRTFGWRRADNGQEMQKFALETMAELVEFSQVVAVALMNTGSPSVTVGGSAVDFVVQTLLPSQLDGEGKMGYKDSHEYGGLCEVARKLLLSLCSKNAMVHEDAVGALAKAVAIEANKTKASAGLMEGASRCLMIGMKLRVMRAVLKTDLANDLAKSMKKLDVEGSAGVEVKTHVLRALAMIGQASAHLARHGEQGGEDMTYSGGTRETWHGMRDRELPVSVVL